MIKIKLWKKEREESGTRKIITLITIQIDRYLFLIKYKNRVVETKCYSDTDKTWNEYEKKTHTYTHTHTHTVYIRLHSAIKYHNSLRLFQERLNIPKLLYSISYTH